MSTSSTGFLLVSASLLVSACTSAAPTNTSTTSGGATPSHTTPTPSASPTPTQTPTQTPTSAPSTTTVPAGKAAVEGNWFSSACGARKYGRNLSLNADGTFTSEDLVSPCPPKVQCVWSGIVNRDGKWKQNGTSVVLEPAASNQHAGEPLASPLSWDGAALSEPGSEKTCVYTRK